MSSYRYNLYWTDPEFIALEKWEREKQRKGLNFREYRASQDRHLMKKMDPEIIPRLKANAKLGLTYSEMQKLKEDENVTANG